MPVINSLSTSSIKKLKRVSDKVTTTPQSTGINNRRRLGGTQGGGGGDATVRPAKLTGGGNGLYKGDLLDEAGEVIENGADFIAALATVYNMPAYSYIVAYKVSTSTLGSN